MYLTYEEYQAYGGTLDETSFTDFEFDAESTINWYTFNRLFKEEWAAALESEQLKRCVYQLIRLKQLEEELLASGSGLSGGIGWRKEPGIIRESNDGVTTEYNVLSSGELLAFANGTRPKKDLIDRYLSCIVNDLGRKLLYRGLYPGEQEKTMFGYILETTNKKTGETYLGKRYAVSFDKYYLGDSEELMTAIDKYGKNC